MKHGTTSCADTTLSCVRTTLSCVLATVWGDKLPIEALAVSGPIRRYDWLWCAVYHHATTFAPVWWAVVRYGPGGEAYFCCALNSAIHVLMYV
jgi:hypothetical protein